MHIHSNRLQMNRFLYKAIFKKTSTWIGAGIIGAIILESTGASLVDRFWRWVNKGVWHSLFSIFVLMEISYGVCLYENRRNSKCNCWCVSLIQKLWPDVQKRLEEIKAKEQSGGESWAALFPSPRPHHSSRSLRFSLSFQFVSLCNLPSIICFGYAHSHSTLNTQHSCWDFK